jgi:hypothetical protein
MAEAMQQADTGLERLDNEVDRGATRARDPKLKKGWAQKELGIAYLTIRRQQCSPLGQREIEELFLSLVKRLTRNMVPARSSRASTR